MPDMAEGSFCHMRGKREFDVDKLNSNIYSYKRIIIVKITK